MSLIQKFKQRRADRAARLAAYQAKLDRQIKVGCLLLFFVPSLSILAIKSLGYSVGDLLGNIALYLIAAYFERRALLWIAGIVLFLVLLIAASLRKR